MLEHLVPGLLNVAAVELLLLLHILDVGVELLVGPAIDMIDEHDLPRLMQADSDPQVVHEGSGSNAGTYSV